MGGLDPAKLLIILVLALIVIGPERLPKAARQIGAFWRDFQQWRERLEDEVRNAVPDLDLPPLPTLQARGVTGYLAGMMSEAARGPRSAPRRDEDPDSEAPAGGAEVGWEHANGSGSPSVAAPAAAEAIVVPNGVPASWGATGADLPGYASGSILSPIPAAAPEAVLAARARIDLDDPSWN